MTEKLGIKDVGLSTLSYLNSFERYTFRRGPLYLDTIDHLNMFVEKLELPSTISSLEGSDIEDFVGALQKYDKTYLLKMVLPLKTLCLRLFEAKRGITLLHCYSLQLLTTWKMYKQALQIIEYPALPIKLSHSLIPVYYFRCYLIYRDLKRYSEAEQALNYANCCTGQQFVTVNVLKHFIVMNIFLGKSSQIHDLLERTREKQSHKSHSISRLLSFGFEKEKAIEEELVHYINLDGQKPLSPSQTAALEKDGLLEFYKEARFANLRQYIKDEIMGVNYRLKASQIRGQCLSDFQVIKGVNKVSSLYRYDRQNGIAYFNHKQECAKEVNEMISKSAGMHTEITNCKQSKQDSRKFAHGFGRF